jgi:hypothetical protein
MIFDELKKNVKGAFARLRGILTFYTPACQQSMGANSKRVSIMREALLTNLMLGYL